MTTHIHPADVQVPTWHLFEARSPPPPPHTHTHTPTHPLTHIFPRRFLLTLPDSLVQQAEKEEKNKELDETIRKDGTSSICVSMCPCLRDYRVYVCVCVCVCVMTVCVVCVYVCVYHV